MSLLQRVKDLVADAHAHGYANELPEPVQRVLHEIASGVEKMAAGGVDFAAIEKAIADKLAGIEPELKAKVDELVKGAIGEMHEAIVTLAQELANLRGELEALKTPPAPVADAPAAAPVAEAAPAAQSEAPQASAETPHPTA